MQRLSISGCAALVALVVLSIATQLSAQPMSAQPARRSETDVTYVPDDAFYAMLARPRSMLKKYVGRSPDAVKLMQAVIRDNNGIRVDNLERIMFVAGFDKATDKADQATKEHERERGFNPGQLVSIEMRFHKAPDQKMIVDRLVENAMESEHAGKKYYERESKYMPSAWFPDDRTLVLAIAPRLKQLMERDSAGMSSLRHHLRRSDPSADAAIVLAMETGGTWFKSAFADEELPLFLRPILELPTHLDVAVVTVDLADDEPAKLFALAVDEKSGKYLTTIVQEFRKALKTMLSENRELIVRHSPSRRIGSLALNVSDALLDNLNLENEGRKIRGTIKAKGGLLTAADLIAEIFAEQHP